MRTRAVCQATFNVERVRIKVHERFNGLWRHPEHGPSDELAVLRDRKADLPTYLMHQVSVVLQIYLSERRHGIPYGDHAQPVILSKLVHDSPVEKAVD